MQIGQINNIMQLNFEVPNGGVGAKLSVSFHKDGDIMIVSVFHRSKYEMSGSISREEFTCTSKAEAHFCRVVELTVKHAATSNGEYDEAFTKSVQRQD